MQFAADYSSVCAQAVCAWLVMHLRRVQIATSLKDHHKYAVKIIKKADSKEGLLLQLQSEHHSGS
jgi:hypothetical protein